MGLPTPKYLPCITGRSQLPLLTPSLFLPTPKKKPFLGEGLSSDFTHTVVENEHDPCVDTVTTHVHALMNSNEREDLPAVAKLRESVCVCVTGYIKGRSSNLAGQQPPIQKTYFTKLSS